MKKNLWLLLLSAFLLSGSFSAEAKKPDPQDDQIASLIQQRLNEKKFGVVLTRVMPLRGQSYTPGSGYVMHIANDTLRVVFPYVGRSLRAELGADEGLRFEGKPISDYQMKPTKQGGWYISFQSRNTSGSCKFTIRIERSGEALVTILPENYENCAYRGVITDE